MLGKNTSACLQGGLLLGTACMLDGLADRFRAELGPETRFYATGNLPANLRKACRTPILYRENLVSDGLYRIMAAQPQGLTRLSCINRSIRPCDVRTGRMLFLSGRGLCEQRLDFGDALSPGPQGFDAGDAGKAFLPPVAAGQVLAGPAQTAASLLRCKI